MLPLRLFIGIDQLLVVHLVPWIVASCCNPQSLLVNNPHHLHCFGHCFACVASVQLHCFVQNSRVPCTHSIHHCSTTTCCHCHQCCCKLLGLPHPGTPFNGIQLCFHCSIHFVLHHKPQSVNPKSLPSLCSPFL